MKKQLIILIICLTVVMTNNALSGDRVVNEQFTDNQTIRYHRHVEQPEIPIFVEATSHVPTTYHLSDLNPLTWSYSSLAKATWFAVFCLYAYKKFWCDPESIGSLQGDSITFDGGSGAGGGGFGISW